MTRDSNIEFDVTRKLILVRFDRFLFANKDITWLLELLKMVLLLELLVEYLDALVELGVELVELATGFATTNSAVWPIINRES